MYTCHILFGYAFQPSLLVHQSHSVLIFFHAMQFIGAEGRPDDEDVSAELIESDVDIKVEQPMQPPAATASEIHQPPTPPMSQHSSPLPHSIPTTMMMNGRPQYTTTPQGMSLSPQSMPPPLYDAPYVQSIQQQSGHPQRIPVCKI